MRDIEPGISYMLGEQYIEIFAKSEDDGLNLGCEFSSWRENESLSFSLSSINCLQNGDGERGSLACSGLCWSY